jgi:hypothetical protein
MEKLIICNFFRDIISGDFGGHPERRRTPEGIKQWACPEI